MFEFFRGWKRKLGCVTLVLACVFMVIWMWSFVIEDEHAYWCELPWGIVAVPLTLLTAWLLLSQQLEAGPTKPREPIPYRIYPEVLAQQIIEGNARNAQTSRQDEERVHLLLDQTIILTMSAVIHPSACVHTVQPFDSILIHADPMR